MRRNAHGQTRYKLEPELEHAILPNTIKAITFSQRHGKAGHNHPLHTHTHTDTHHYNQIVTKTAANALIKL